jgi:hypothetical protein
VEVKLGLCTQAHHLDDEFMEIKYMLLAGLER